MRKRCAVYGLLIAFGTVTWCAPALAQTQAGCGASGYRVIASRWDAVLARGWELRQDCAHPEWPARLAVAAMPGSFPLSGAGGPAAPVAALVVQPLLVHAGESVRLWEQDSLVRIEMSGVAEQSARAGERVVVKVTRQTDDAGLTVDRVGGIVRGAGDVEIER
jgi:hypothetical protein